MSDPATILIIEDNVDAAESLAEVLSAEGYRATIAADGPAGVDAAHRTAPAAILCDIGLPGFSGYEVASLLRRERQFSGVPMVAITGYAQFADRQRALAAGFDEHMSKPVELGTLMDFLRERLGRAASGGRP